MKKLFALLASGALVLAIAPATMAATGDNLDCYANGTSYFTGGTPVACTTGVTVNVGTGTTIILPAAITLGGWPGQLAKSTDATIAWITNDTSTAYIKASLAGSGFAATGSATELQLNHVFLAESAAKVGNFSSAVNVATLGAVTNDYAGRSQVFQLWADIPSVAAGAYTGTLTFSVAP